GGGVSIKGGRARGSPFRRFRSSSSNASDSNHSQSAIFASAFGSSCVLTRIFLVVPFGRKSVSLRATGSQSGGSLPSTSVRIKGFAFHHVVESNASGSDEAGGAPGNCRKTIPIANGSGR